MDTCRACGHKHHADVERCRDHYLTDAMGYIPCGCDTCYCDNCVNHRAWESHMLEAQREQRNREVGGHGL